MSALQSISAVDTKAIAKKPDTQIIDIREPDEYAREHIAGSLNLPLSTLHQTDYAQFAGKRLIFHCKSGMRTQQAAALLAQFACAENFILVGGLEEWKTAKFPLAQDKKAPLELMRQVQLIVGGIGIVGVVLGLLWHPAFFALTLFVNTGLFFAGATGFCGLAKLLLLLPYNKTATKS